MQPRQQSELLGILIAGSDHIYASRVGRYLEGQGHAVDFANSSQSCVQLCEKFHYSVVVILQKLRGGAWLDTCRTIKASVREPLLILVVSNDRMIQTTLAAFEAGADDCVDAATAVEEVTARLLALARARRRAFDRTLRVGGLELDSSKMELRTNGIPVHVSPAGLKLLSLLMQQSPRPVSHATLLEKLGADGIDKVAGRIRIRAHVYQLRRALGRTLDSCCIKTYPCMGYAAVPIED